MQGSNFITNRLGGLQDDSVVSPLSLKDVHLHTMPQTPQKLYLFCQAQWLTQASCHVIMHVVLTLQGRLQHHNACTLTMHRPRPPDSPSMSCFHYHYTASVETLRRWLQSSKTPGWPRCTVQDRRTRTSAPSAGATLAETRANAVAQAFKFETCTVPTTKFDCATL